MPNYIDNSFVNFSVPFLTSNVVSYPFPYPNNSDTKEFELAFVQYQNAYTEPALGSTSAYAPSAYLTAKGPFTKIGAGVVRYQLTYTQLPATWGEKQQITYNFPGLSGTNGVWSAYYFRSPVTLFANATITHSYTQGATSPNPDPSFLVTDGGNVVDYIGLQNPNIGAGVTSPSVEPSTYNVSSDVQQVRALIWEKISAVVPKPI